MITLVQSYFRDYPAESRLWVFMAERKLDEVETKVIKTYMDQFMPQWNAHGNALKGGYEWIFDQFLVIAVDESPAAASGCSIDSLTRYIKLIEDKIGTSFTDRMLVSYFENDQMKTEKLFDFKKKVKNGDIAKNTIVFNNSVSNLSDFWDNWQQPLDQSWAANLVPKAQ